jgi:hypothetical protein
MFKLPPLLPDSAEIAEVSFHEGRDLAARQSTRGPNINRFCKLSGVLDLALLQDALQQLTRRHDALRTRFGKNACGAFSRRVEATAEIPLVYADFRDFPADDPCVKAHVRGIASQGFSTEDFPLMRLGVLSTTTDETVLVVTVAELIADGRAVSILVKELSASYEALRASSVARLPPVQWSLSQYAAAHAAWMKTADYCGKLDWLREKLHRQVAESGGAETLFFAPQSKESFLIAHRFSSQVVADIFHAARTAKVSLPSFLMALTGVSILRAREAQHLFFTSTFSNRHVPGTANLVGHLATTMPCFLNASGEGAWTQCAQALHRDLFLSMSQFGMIPIAQIVAGFDERYAPLPDGANIKFGKVVMDVTQEDDAQLFGLESSAFVADFPQGIGALYKFAFQLPHSGGLRLWLRGLKVPNNQDLAERIVGALMEDTLSAMLP